MSKHETTPAPVTIEQAREGEDTHQWIARLHRENAQKAAQKTTEAPTGHTVLSWAIHQSARKQPLLPLQARGGRA